MEKRGQVTLFVIIGIIIVATVLLLVFARDRIYTPATPENLGQYMENIKEHMTDCLEQAGAEGVERIALQGGYLAVPEGSYRYWNDTTISYLCYNQIGRPTCTNRMLTIAHMEEELADFMDKELTKCVDLSGVSGAGLIQTFDVIPSKKKFETEVTIHDQEVLVKLEYPITLKARGSSNQKTEKEFRVMIDRPLGELYSVAMDIVNTEAQFGMFDVLTYVLSKTGRYTIYPHKPYPDKLFQIKMREGNFMFQMAVEGEPT